MYIDQTTETALWVSLVQEGQRRSGTTLSEQAESHTVFMLMRHMHNTHLLDIPVASLYLKSLEEKDTVKALHLEKTGDHALLIAGLFPERHVRARVSADYFLSMSQIAYISLSDVFEKLRHYKEAEYYALIATKAEDITHVLTCSRKPPMETP